MAKCTRCGINWKWDFCNDTYRAKPDIWARQTTIAVDGRNEESTNKEGWATDKKDKVLPHNKFGADIDMYICTCGKIIGFCVNDDEGGGIFNLPEWDCTEWDGKEAWPGC